MTRIYHAHIYHDLDLPCSSVPWLTLPWLESTPLSNVLRYWLAGHAFGYCLSALGASLLYNREKYEKIINLGMIWQLLQGKSELWQM